MDEHQDRTIKDEEEFRRFEQKFDSFWAKNKRRLMLLLGILAFFMMISNCNSNPARGEKVGQLVKVADQGWFFKTCEAQLIRGGFTDGSGTVGATPFDFTIDDPGLKAKAEGYMRNQQEVIIKYKISYFYFSMNSENHGTYLLDIIPVKK